MNCLIAKLFKLRFPTRLLQRDIYNFRISMMPSSLDDLPLAANRRQIPHWDVIMMTVVDNGKKLKDDGKVGDNEPRPLDVKIGVQTWGLYRTD